MDQAESRWMLAVNGQDAISPSQHTAPLSSSQERPSGPSLSPVLPIQSFRHHHFTFSHISIY